MSKSLLNISNLSKAFNDRKILESIDFAVYENELIGILGANGSGKSTLFKIIINLISADSGYVKHTKEDLKLGFANNNYRSFYWRLTGRQNLNFFSAISGINKSIFLNKIDELTDLFECKDILDIPFSKYSSGQMQTFSLIRCLIDTPDILLLDEPCTNLDINSSNLLKEKILSYKNNFKTAILWSTHEAEEIEDIYNRIFIIQNSKLHEFNRGSFLSKKIRIKFRRESMQENHIKNFISQFSVKLGQDGFINFDEANFEQIGNFIGNNLKHIQVIDTNRNSLKGFYLEKISRS